MLRSAKCDMRMRITTARLLLRSVTVVVVLGLFHAPAFAQDASPVPPPPAVQAETPSQNQEQFGEEVMLTAKPMVFVSGKTTWDKAYPTLLDKFKSISGFLSKQKIAPAGGAMTIYTSVYDTGFAYQAAIPLAEAPAKLPRGAMTMGQSPAGKALKFVHRGSYESMEMLYEAITNHLDGKGIEKPSVFLEEYVTDPVTTPEDKLVVHIFVLVR